MRRRIAGGVAALAAAVGSFLFGFGGTSVSAPDPITMPVSGYLALGDSYSAGEGLNPYLNGTQNIPFGNRCHRSQRAYGALLAGANADRTSFTFKACSGAVIAQVANESQQHDGVDVGGPQLRDVTNAGLVTMTIGGNDALFADVVQYCALQLNCIDTPKWRRDGFPTLRAWVEPRLAHIGTDLGALFDELATTLPRARVLVLGYPRLFTLHPTSGGQRSCLVYGLFSANERAQLRQLGNELNLEIARHALAAGFEYVHVADAFDDHETCGPKGQWLQFFRLDIENLTSKNVLDSGNFHPTADGQAMIARLVRCYLAAHPDNDVAPDVRARAAHANGLASLLGDRPAGRRGDAVYECAMGRS